MFQNMKIAKKIILGFSVVAFILTAVICYQIIVITDLGKLQDAGAARAVDSQSIAKIEMNFLSIYPHVADVIINKNMKEFDKYLAELEVSSQMDIDLLDGLVDTAEEKEIASSFNKAYKEYFNTIKLLENELEKTE